MVSAGQGLSEIYSELAEGSNALSGCYTMWPAGQGIEYHHL